MEATLDLRGIPCPQNTAKALMSLELLDEGEKMKIYIDDGEPYLNFLDAMEYEDDLNIFEKVKKKEHWFLFIERKLYE